MHLSTRNVSMISALVIAGVMIGGAFLLTSPLLEQVSAASTEDTLRAYASKDSDNDGLPDWQETLYNTDPNNAHSIRPDVTDGEAVSKGLVTAKFVAATSTPIKGLDKMPGGISTAPQTLTDRFGRGFLQNYLTTSQAGPMSADAMNQFVNSAESALLAEKQPVYNGLSLKLDTAGTESMTDYLNAVADAFRPHVTDHEVDRTVLDDMYDYATASDKTKLAHVREVGQLYIDAASDLMKVRVPSEAADDHLALANALVTLGTATQDMAAIDTDPLRGMLGLKEYQEAWDTMASTLKSYYSDMHAKLIASPESETSPTP